MLRRGETARRTAKRLIGALAACVAMLVAGAGVASAATLTVANEHDSGSGSLRQTIADARSGDTIVFSPAVLFITLHSQIEFNKSLTISGPGAFALSISANHEDRIFHIKGGDVTVSGLTLQDGKRVPGFLALGGPAFGGAIYDEGTGSLTLDRVRAKDNVVAGDITAWPDTFDTQFPEGGAIFANGPVSVTDSDFESNHAGITGTDSGGGGGGAIWAEPGPQGGLSISILRSTFNGNTAGNPGDGNDNRALDYGGAVFGNQITVDSSTFTANHAGGAGQTDPFSANPAGNGTGSGGAIEAGFMKVLHSSFVGNTAGGPGGDARQSGQGEGGAIDSGELDIFFSTFADNRVGGPAGAGPSSGSGFGAAISGGASLRLTDSTVTQNVSGGPRDPNGGGVGGGVGHGALFVDGDGTGFSTGPSRLVADTIDRNVAGGRGATGSVGGLAGAAFTSVTDSIISTNIVNNTFVNCDAHIARGSYNLEDDAGRDCGFDLRVAEPGLAALGDNGGPTQTQALYAGSAIDAIPVRCATKADQRGLPRPDNGERRCDVGAYEVQDGNGSGPDTAPPVVTVTAPAPPAGQGGFFNASQLPVTVSVSATDASAVTDISCTVTTSSGPVTADASAQTGSHPRTGTVLVSADGLSTVTCTATDSDSPTPHSGAAPGSHNSATVMVDNTLPTLSVRNVTTFADSSGTGATLTAYPAGTVTVSDPDGSVDTPSAVCTPSLPFRFPVGTTTVTCTAVDRAGNQSSPMSFTVTVGKF